MKQFLLTLAVSCILASSAHSASITIDEYRGVLKAYGAATHLGAVCDTMSEQSEFFLENCEINQYKCVLFFEYWDTFAAKNGKSPDEWLEMCEEIKEEQRKWKDEVLEPE